MQGGLCFRKGKVKLEPQKKQNKQTGKMTFVTVNLINLGSVS